MHIPKKIATLLYLLFNIPVVLTHGSGRITNPKEVIVNRDGSDRITNPKVTVVTVNRDGKIPPVQEGHYVFRKSNVSILTIFASTTIMAESPDKFYISISNSSSTEDKALWWRALFLREKHNKFVKKVSPFEDIHFKIEFVPGISSSSSNKTKSVDLKILYKARDFTNFYWFIGGVMLFFVARKLSRSVLFHYSSGASIGMLMSWMIILVMLYRLLPYRRAMTTLVVTGTGAGFYFTEMVLNKGYQLVLQYPYQVFCVCTFFGLLSMALIYYFGPPSTEKSFNLIQWSLQIGAIYMVYQSSYCKEFSITAIITVMFLQFISVYSVLIRIFVLVTPRRFQSLFNRPEKRRLLTLEEYDEEGKVETEKALRELSKFCSSPDCNSWKVISRLKDPKRFAKFCTEDEHFTSEELEAYDQFEEPSNLFDESQTDSVISETWMTDDEIHSLDESLASATSLS